MVTDTYDRSAPGRQNLTTRDLVWDATIELLHELPFGLTAWRVRERAGLDESKNRTIRRTLSSMEDLGYLERDSENEKRWYHGPKAKELIKDC